MWKYASKKRMTKDGIAVEGACVLFSISGRGTTGGSIATLYDAQSADSSKTVCTVVAPANTLGKISFDPPIVCDNGLYVDFADNGVEVLLSYRDIHTNPDLWERVQRAEVEG